MIKTRIEKITHKSLLPLLLMLFFSVSMVAHSQTQENISSAATESTMSLNQIRTNLDDVNAKRDKVLAELETTTDPDQRETLEMTLSQLDQQKRNFERVFERTALGGLEVSLYEVSNDEEEEILQYDWQKELIKIVQPVFR